MSKSDIVIDQYYQSQMETMIDYYEHKSKQESIKYLADYYRAIAQGYKQAYQLYFQLYIGMREREND